MELLRRRAYARAGLLGNPSDGYQGKTIAIIVRNLYAEVVLYEWDEIEVIRSDEDKSRFGSIYDLARDVDLHGYYGGIRLIKATIKRFVDYCNDNSIQLDRRNFSIRYSSNIPRQVGLAGSSAIIVAMLQALMDFYRVSIPERAQPSLVLSVETDELGISAGLQDRVIQIYGGAVFMDFAEEATQFVGGLSCGSYERLEPTLLPRLYVAYRDDSSEPGEVFHNNLRARYDSAEPAVVDAMLRFAELAVQGRQLLQAGQPQELGPLIDENFETRRSICQLPPRQIEMVEAARAAGASAKFAGSGGAIIGSYADADSYERLKAHLESIGCRVLRPQIA